MNVLPDPEALLIQALRSVDAVAAIVGGEVRTRLSGTYPAVRVTLLGGPARPAENTGQPEFQVECVGSGTDSRAEVEAATLARTVEGSLALLPGVYPAGKVVGAYPVGFTLHQPFGDTARERYIVQLGLIVQGI